MPVLTIIAGPNGAGKSTHSKELLASLGIEAFDFDKEFYSIWSQFDFDPLVEQGAFDRAQELYVEKRTDALHSNQNFAFETNYHGPQIISIVEIFKAKGYDLELIFICLESPEVAIERVKDRVTKGGHPVSEVTIRQRFTAGLDRLNETFYLFDTVFMYHSEYRSMKGILALKPKAKKVIFVAPIPAALEPRLPQLKKFVETHDR